METSLAFIQHILKNEPIIIFSGRPLFRIFVHNVRLRGICVKTTYLQGMK
jgi:hypothetical protein